MRIHGIHVQGLREPGGEQQLNLDAGYNVVLTSNDQASAGFLALIRAFLFPRTDLGNLEIWRDRASQRPARAGLSVSFASEVYRLILDADRERLALGRYVAHAGNYERVSTDLEEIEGHLHAAGVPARDEFMLLNLVQGPPHAYGALPEGSESATGLHEQLAARLAALKSARDRRIALDRDRERLNSEIEKRSVLRNAMDDIEPQLGRLRELEAERSRDRVTIEQSRRELLDERAVLRSEPKRQEFPLLIGVILAALGALAGHKSHSLFYLFALLGAVVALSSLVMSSQARRRMGTVEAMLAALRVRERSVEKEFESQSASIRSVMQVLELESLDDLLREVNDFRGMLSRAREVEQELEDLNDELGISDLDGEIRRLETAVAEAARNERRALTGDETHGEADVALVWSTPSDLMRAAALASGRSDDDVQRRFDPALPGFLHALTGGEFGQARHVENEGWLLHGQGRGEVTPYEELEGPQRSAVHLAFRLALLEALAPEHSVPLVLGGSMQETQEPERLALASVLRRLGSAVQVIQFSDVRGAWTQQAETICDTA